MSVVLFSLHYSISCSLLVWKVESILKSNDITQLVFLLLQCSDICSGQLSRLLLWLLLLAVELLLLLRIELLRIELLRLLSIELLLLGELRLCLSSKLLLLLLLLLRKMLLLLLSDTILLVNFLLD